MGSSTVNRLADKRRELRWEKEAAAQREATAHREMIQAIADWKGVGLSSIKLSNVYCNKAPADLHCTYVSSSHPMTNPCVFCGHPEEDVF